MSKINVGPIIFSNDKKELFSYYKDDTFETIEEEMGQNRIKNEKLLNLLFPKICIPYEKIKCVCKKIKSRHRS